MCQYVLLSKNKELKHFHSLSDCESILMVINGPFIFLLRKGAFKKKKKSQQKTTTGIPVVSQCGVWESLRLKCPCLLSLQEICKTFSRVSSLQSLLTALLGIKPPVRSCPSIMEKGPSEGRESHWKCWISAVLLFIQISRKTHPAVPWWLRKNRSHGWVTKKGGRG